MNLHEIDVDEEWLVRLLGSLVQKLERCLFDIAVKERNTDHALFPVDHRCIDVLAVDLEIFLGWLSCFARQRSLGDGREHFPQLGVHVREPRWIGIGIGVEVIEADVLHHIVALSDWHGVVSLAKVPFAGEVGAVTGLFQHGRERPFRSGKSAALALESHRGHAAAIGYAAGLHCSASWSATGLRIEREEGHPLRCKIIDVWGRHSPAYAAAVRAEVSETRVV